MDDSKINYTNYSLLILCAGARSYHEDFCLIEPLLNIGNTLAIDRIKKRYSTVKLKIYVAYNENSRVLNKLESFKDFQFLNVGNTEGVIQTIEISLNYIKEKYVEILPITTIPDKEYERKKAIYFGEKEIFKENWSSLKYSESRKVIFSRKKDKENNYQNSFPFTGRISSSRLDLIDAIKFIPKNQRNDLINLASILYFNYKYEIIHEKWFDLGHSVTYVETKNQDISSRAFNKLIFNSKKFTITKLSKKSLLLSEEKDYYKSIPKRYARYFPNVFTEKNNNKIESLEMEYIAFPNLAEIFLFRKMGPNFWHKLSSYIYYIYKDFYEYSEPCAHENLSWFYSQKLEKRTLELEDL